MNKPCKIYLCDLTYDTIILVSDTIPINIGFIGSYLKNNLKDPLKMYLSDLFTVPMNLAGIASLNIPAGFSSNNLPIGLQLVSNSFKEETLFSFAHILSEEEIFEAS